MGDIAAIVTATATATATAATITAAKVCAQSPFIAHHGLDPWLHRTDIGIDAGKAWQSTTNSPRNDSYVNMLGAGFLEDNRPSRISLTRIDASVLYVTFNDNKDGR